MSEPDMRVHDTPLRDPDHRDESGERSAAVKWHVGSPDTEGYQPQALLEVHYRRGNGYTATLRASREKQEEWGVSQVLNLSFSAPSVVISTSTADRFSRRTLLAELDNAIAVLRRLYEAEASDIREFFDPAAAPFTN